MSFPDTSLSSFQQRAAENAVIASFRSLTDDLVAPASKFLFIFEYTVVFYTVVLYDEYRKRGESMRSKEDIAKLVAMMKENNWTQVKLAERLHVSQQVISRTITEKGTIKMSPMKVEMMYQLIAKPYPASDIQI